MVRSERYDGSVARSFTLRENLDPSAAQAKYKDGVLQLTAGDICKHRLTVGYRQTTRVAAAQLMREDHVGSVVVIDEDNGSCRVCGMVTDRDIVMAVVATGLQPEPLCLEDIISERLVTVAEGDSLTDLMRAMRDHGVRRLPVVDAQGELLGLVTMDTAIRQEHVRRH